MGLHYYQQIRFSWKRNKTMGTYEENEEQEDYSSGYNNDMWIWS